MSKIVAPFVIAYDFDGTLSPCNMQEFGFVFLVYMNEGGFESYFTENEKVMHKSFFSLYQQLEKQKLYDTLQQLTKAAQNEGEDFYKRFNLAVKQVNRLFWDKSMEIAKKQEADPILSYMQLFLDYAQREGVELTREFLQTLGQSIQFFDGILGAGQTGWFDRIRAYGAEQGIDVQHYIISSGMTEMIEGTPIAHHFEKIYASKYMYDEQGQACWPALAINYTTKTQYLFRINKNSLDVTDDSRINAYLAEDKRTVPFDHMVFIGDGFTDIPCMRLVKDKGGYAIAVYSDQITPSLGNLNQVFKLVQDGRCNLATKADYSEDSPIDKAVKAMIDQVVAQTKIEQLGIHKVD
ncbi:MAG: haloacid dehalogenase-like hydrolase [Pasteurella sp.]|nr:haloacid dehalogenase-like hydrolase [Pasteurella sp.]